VDFQTPVVALDRMRIPKSFNGRNPQSRRDLAVQLRSRVRSLEPTVARRNRSARSPEVDTAIAEIRRQLRAHPCHECPDREDHARWAERWSRLDQDARTLKRRIEQRTNTIARRFDRICEVLEARGYLNRVNDDLRVGTQGQKLKRIYSDLDLLVAESIQAGDWAGLDAPTLAAVLSTIVFEARKPEEGATQWIPTPTLAEALARLRATSDELISLEKQHNLAQLHEPDTGLAGATYLWAKGQELDDVLDQCDLAAGDFVRWMKQIIDLAGQVADACGDDEMRSVAKETIALLRRGVVAYSSVID
ncbi:MAG TPA: RNA helicase, partial [Marmoricola sp.]|nr:RNA helicase [Marmoricola sp.]